MTCLNKIAKETAEKYDVHSCTDVTGFGLAGHGTEMADGSNVTLKISISALPVQPEAAEYAKMGMVPEGAYRNRNFTEKKVDCQAAKEFEQDIFYDPQTSGGLLLSVSPEDGENIIKDLKAVDLNTSFAIIGTVVEREEKSVRLVP